MSFPFSLEVGMIHKVKHNVRMNFNINKIHPNVYSALENIIWISIFNKVCLDVHNNVTYSVLNSTEE